MSEERRSNKGGPRFGFTFPSTINCRSSVQPVPSPPAGVNPHLWLLSQEMRVKGLDAAADALLLPSGPSNAPGSWEEVAKVLGYETVMRISKIAGA